MLVSILNFQKQKNIKQRGDQNVSHNCYRLLKNNRDDNFIDYFGFNGSLKNENGFYQSSLRHPEDKKFWIFLGKARLEYP